MELKDILNFCKNYCFAVLICIASLSILNYFLGTVCFSVMLFGIPCPACGITRATKLLLTGHFVESFQMHPLLVLVIIGCLLYLILNILLKKYIDFIKYYGIICILIFICFYIYRMKMYYPNVEPMLYREDNLLSKLFSFIQYMKR